MAVALGVCFEISATAVGTIGKQLLSYSAKIESKSNARVLKFSGLFITTLVGPILDMGAYAFAPQSIIAPLNGLDIVWNTMSAPFTLGERLTIKHVVGSTLVFTGAALTSALGPHHDPPESLEWLRSIFLSERFLSYLIVWGSGLAMSVVVLLQRPKGVRDRARGMALGLTAGGIAGNMFFISAGLGMIGSSARTGSWEAWNNWLPYLVLFCGVLMAVSNIPFMTKGLQEYEALYMVTLFEGSHITVACVSGDWVLREMDGQTALRKALYWCCVLLIVCGLCVIQGAKVSRPVHREASNSFRTSSWQPSCLSVASGDPADDMAAKQQQQSSEAVEQPADGRAGVTRALTRQASATGTVVWVGGLSGIGSMSFEDPEADDSSEDDDGVDETDGTADHDRLDDGDSVVAEAKLEGGREVA